MDGSEEGDNAACAENVEDVRAKNIANQNVALAPHSRSNACANLWQGCADCQEREANNFFRNAEGSGQINAALNNQMRANRQTDDTDKHIGDGALQAHRSDPGLRACHHSLQASLVRLLRLRWPWQMCRGHSQEAR